MPLHVQNPMQICSVDFVLGRVPKVCALVLIAVIAFLVTHTSLAAPRVTVSGASRLEVRASGPSASLTVIGALRDENGSPITDAQLVVTPLANGDVPVRWQSVAACGASDRPSFSSDPERTVTTDSVGSFCLRGVLSRGDATIRVVFGGTPLHEATRTEVLWDAAQRPASLQFSPRPDRIDLDAPRVIVFARFKPPDGVSPLGYKISLDDGNGKKLAESPSDASGDVHFDLPTSAFEGPGIGTLRATFAGDGDLTMCSVSATVTRTARVRMAPEEQELRGDPSRGIGMRLHATTSRGLAEGGMVEASAGHERVGTASVREGVADLTLSFRPRRDYQRTAITLRYKPDAPYYESAGSVGIVVISEQPSPWLRVLPIAAALAVAAWLLRGWWRPRRREPSVPRRGEPTGVPSLEVVGASGERDAWTGRVIDAHEGTPIGNARIRVTVPTFVEEDVVVDVRAGDDGSFAFRVRSSEKELRLTVESEWHAAVERALPPPSDMVVALVSRRRILVERLVKWARRAGKPWFREPEPTPGHVARVSRQQRQGGGRVESWAEQVERRAYGPDPVDAAAEREVREMEPRGQPLR